MKIKQFLHITDTLAFSKGNYGNCFSLFEHDIGNVAGWMNCGKVEFEVDIDSGQAVKSAIEDIEKQEEKERLKFTERMAYLEESKQELLCIGCD